VADDAGRVVAEALTKRFGPVTAVDGLSFAAGPGTVTGFLGPNGAGKSTTLRMLLGLARPDSGTATISGRPYRELREPGREVGAVLEATGFHPGRGGLAHLLVCCAAGGYPPARAQQVLDLVHLAGDGRRAVRGYSLGMRQRLALATALLGDPAVLVLDEPGNGLDPEGIAWLRGLLRGYARQGRTVLFSSHVLAEVEQLADRVVIITGGRLAAEGALAGLAGPGAAVSVRSPQAAELGRLLAAAGGRAEQTGPDRLHVTGLATAEISRIARAHRIDLHELTPGHDLEHLFLALTAGPERPGARPDGERS
jgi:ABC-2 type transport system ATP-binding protein